MKRNILLIAFLTILFNLNAQAPKTLRIGSLTINKIDYGKIEIGENILALNISNHSDSARNLYVSIRVEGISNWQQTEVFDINARATLSYTKKYIIADASCGVIKFQFIVPKKTFIGPNNPIKRKYPSEIDHIAKEKFNYDLDFENEKVQFWSAFNSEKIRSEIPALRKRLNVINQSKRDSLIQLIRVNRNGHDNFNAKKTDAKIVSNTILVDTWELEGEPNESIGFLLMQKQNLPKPYKTILYLTGNPPGRKEPQVNKLLLLAKAGYRVAIMDRRLSARKTLPGEFWNNTANPVFDAMHLIDYIMMLDETNKDVGIAIMGFSKGAAESQLVAALHEDVSCAILLSRMIDYDVLFNSSAWWPTLYIPKFIIEMGADSILKKPWQDQLDFMTTDVLKVVKQKFQEHYPFYNSKEILKLVAPKPMLLVTGAWDSQFPIEGVLTLDAEIAGYYLNNKVLPAYNLYIMPRGGHGYNAQTLNLIINYLSIWY